MASAGIVAWRVGPAHPLGVALGIAAFATAVLAWRRHRGPLLLVVSCVWWFVSSPFVAFMARVGPNGLTQRTAASIPSAAFTVVLVGLVVTVAAARQGRRNAWLTVVLCWIAYTGAATLVGYEAGPHVGAAAALSASALVLLLRGRLLHNLSTKRALRLTHRTSRAGLTPAACQTLKLLGVVGPDWTLLKPDRRDLASFVVAVGPTGAYCLSSHATLNEAHITSTSVRIAGTDLKRLARDTARTAGEIGRTCRQPTAALVVLHGERISENLQLLRAEHGTRLVHGQLVAGLLRVNSERSLSAVRARRCVARLRRHGFLVVAPPKPPQPGDAVVRVTGDHFRAGWRLLPPADLPSGTDTAEGVAALCQESDWRRARRLGRRVRSELVLAVREESVFKRSLRTAP